MEERRESAGQVRARAGEETGDETGGKWGAAGGDSWSAGPAEQQRAVGCHNNYINHDLYNNYMIYVVI